MIGIGYRKDFARKFLDNGILHPDFIEVAPENWIGYGGQWRQRFLKALEQYPLYLHGLSLSIGSPEGIDVDFVKKVKQFMDDHGAVLYSEHMSFTKVDNAHLYDLLPIPFTEDGVRRVVENIEQVQDIIQRKLIIENSSYYTTLECEMTEVEFINELTKRSGCELLLDVNNVYVNSFNHGYDAQNFISQLPLDRVQYIHMAGHLQVSDQLIIDTHGEDIIDPVYQLFDFATRKIARDVPVLLERDFNIPDFEGLQSEIDTLRKIKENALKEVSHA